MEHESCPGDRAAGQPLPEPLTRVRRRERRQRVQRPGWCAGKGPFAVTWHFLPCASQSRCRRRDCAEPRRPP